MCLLWLSYSKNNKLVCNDKDSLICLSTAWHFNMLLLKQAQVFFLFTSETCGFKKKCFRDDAIILKMPRKASTGSLILLRGSAQCVGGCECEWVCVVSWLTSSLTAVTTPCATCWKKLAAFSRGCAVGPGWVMFPGAGTADGGLCTTDPWRPRSSPSRRLGSHVCWARSRLSKM